MQLFDSNPLSLFPARTSHTLQLEDKLKKLAVDKPNLFSGWVRLRLRIATTDYLKFKVAIWYGLAAPKTDIGFVGEYRCT